GFEVGGRSVGVKWDSRPVGAVAARRLGDEHYSRRKRAVQPAQHGLPLTHPLADDTVGGLVRQLVEKLVMEHSVGHSLKRFFLEMAIPRKVEFALETITNVRKR